MLGCLTFWSGKCPSMIGWKITMSTWLVWVRDSIRWSRLKGCYLLSCMYSHFSNKWGDSLFFHPYWTTYFSIYGSVFFYPSHLFQPPRLLESWDESTLLESPKQLGWIIVNRIWSVCFCFLSVYFPALQ